MKGLAEDIGLPDLGRVPLKLLEQIVDHLLALFLAAHDGGHLRLDVRPDHVNGGCAGLQTHAVPPALADDLRLLQHQGVDGGHHDAVSGLLHLLQSVGHLVVLRLHLGQLGEQGHQVPVVPDLEPRLLGQRIIE